MTGTRLRMAFLQKMTNTGEGHFVTAYEISSLKPCQESTET